MKPNIHNIEIEPETVFDRMGSGKVLPTWLVNIKEDFDYGLYSGFVLYGNVDDLYPMAGNLVRLDEFLVNYFKHDVAVILDPAIGIIPIRGFESVSGQFNIDPSADIPTRLHKFLLELYRLRKTVAPLIILQGAKHWLGNRDNHLGLLVRRIVENSSHKDVRPTVIVLAERLGELSQDLVDSAYFKKADIQYPSSAAIQEVLEEYSRRYYSCFEDIVGDLGVAADRLAGVGTLPLVNLIKRKAAKDEKLSMGELEAVKQRLVEETCGGLLEFINPTINLSALHGQEHLKKVIRRDIAIWGEGKKSNISVPKGYLLIGPVGIGKTYFVEALAGEADVPVVKLNNFRSSTPGETEANLEKIFRMLKSLSRCYVFIDEADQAMGSRQSGSDGSAGRVYSMFAQEIASESNRGKIIWIMATSQPHKLEPDLKRPGRMDLKIPLLPCETHVAGLAMIHEFGKRRNLELEDPKMEDTNFALRETITRENKYILGSVPEFLTPASAVVIVDEISRKKREGGNVRDRELLMDALKEYQPMISPVIMREQCRLAVRESSDLRFVPHEFQYLAEVDKPFIVL